MIHKASKLFLEATDTVKELLIVYFSVIGLATVAYAFFENRSIYDALWWSFVTALTVGYGDISPTTLGGRITAVALMHVVPLYIIPLIIAHLLGKVVKNANEFTDAEQQVMRKDLQDIKKLLKDV